MSPAGLSRWYCHLQASFDVMPATYLAAVLARHSRCCKKRLILCRVLITVAMPAYVMHHICLFQRLGSRLAVRSCPISDIYSCIILCITVTEIERPVSTSSVITSLLCDNNGTEHIPAIRQKAEQVPVVRVRPLLSQLVARA